MTFAAHWEQQPEIGSGRRGSRRKLQLEATGSVAGSPVGKVVVHNISATGLLIESSLQLETGETIEIDLPQAGVMNAKVVWTGNGYFGCQFEQPITNAAISAAQLRSSAVPPPQVNPPVRGELTGEAFGMRLQRLRKQKGLTLMQLAHAIGVSKPTVWAWEQERSRPTQDRYGPLAQALGVEPADLLPERNDRPLREMLARFKEQIAQAVGTSPEKVKILLEL